MSRWQNDKTFECTRNLTKDKRDRILKQHNQRYNEIRTRMFIVSKEETKQKIRIRIRNKQIKESLKRDIN